MVLTVEIPRIRKEHAVLKILVPVDGSEPSLRAVRHVVRRLGRPQDAEIHVLNVQPPIPQAITTFVDRESVKGFHHDEGTAALKEGRAVLDHAGLKYQTHIAVGGAAETIAAYAREHQCDEVIMGARGLGAVLSLLLGSTTTKLLHLVDVPVTIVK